MPDTKQVLGRTFVHAPTRHNDFWTCAITNGTLDLEYFDGNWEASLYRGHVIATSRGPTEADAILALQSRLRKMAMLEVSDG